MIDISGRFGTRNNSQNPYWNVKRKTTKTAISADTPPVCASRKYVCRDIILVPQEERTHTLLSLRTIARCTPAKNWHQGASLKQPYVGPGKPNESRRARDDDTSGNFNINNSGIARNVLQEVVSK